MKTNSKIPVPFGTNSIKSTVSLKIVLKYYYFNNSIPNLIQNTDMLYCIIQHIVGFMYNNLVVFYFKLPIMDTDSMDTDGLFLTE